MFGGECGGVVVYFGLGCGGVGGGSVGLWGVSLIGVAHVMLGCCFWACLVGFGCGSVRVEVTLNIGCVWLTM